MRKAFGILVLAMLFIGTMLSSTMIPAVAEASQADINNAIEKGLAYLNSTQAADGSWGASFAPVACTAMAVLAFENANHTADNVTDPYHTDVAKGLDYLFTQAHVDVLTNKSAGNPDVSGDGIGIYFYSYNVGYPHYTDETYQTPMVLMAIVGSGNQSRIATTGPANVTGRTYYAIVQDIVDWIAWAQNDNTTGVYEGGWRYTANFGSSDNSVSQWPILGLLTAELWGIKGPPWVQTELIKWLSYSQNLNGNYSSNTYYGAFGYTDAYTYDSIAETAAGILGLTYCNVTNTDPRIVAAEGYVVRDWLEVSGWRVNFGWFYAMYAVMKACRLATLTPIDLIENYTGSPTIEWYNGTGEYADYLVTNQQGDGSWVQSSAAPEDVDISLSTAWGVLILEYVPVKVTWNLKVDVVDANSGKSISGANVIAIGPENLSGVTDGGMTVFNETQAGDYEVTASNTRYVSASVSVSLTNDTDITIRLTPLTYTLTVHIVEANTGSSISAATVVAVGPQNLSGVTDGGTVVFDDTQAGSYNVTASKNGYASASVNVTLAGNTEITIRLTPLTYTLTVQVVDAKSGNLLSGATLIAAGPKNLTGTTEGGIVVFDEIQASTYNVTASMTGYASASVSVTLIGNTEITIRLTPLFPRTQLWILAIIIGLAAILGTGAAIFLIAGADRIRRKRKEKRNHWRALEAGFDT